MEINEIRKILARLSLGTLATGACLGLVLSCSS